MIRRRLIIEWNDEGTDTDEECASSFVNGEWGIEDVLSIQAWELQHPDKVGQYPIDLKVWVVDAPEPPVDPDIPINMEE